MVTIIIFKKYSEATVLKKEIERLYKESFPPKERRRFEKLEALLAEEQKPIDMLVATDEEGRLVGFFSYWTFGGFVYGEHFAVNEAMRGTGCGTAVLDEMKREVGAMPLLIEVEPPTTEHARRRIRFYERNGFVLREDVEYYQPPYEEGQEGLELKLMHTGTMREEMICAAVKKIKREVYGVKVEEK